MLQVLPTWMAGYAAVILLMTVLLNLVLLLPRYAYGLTLPFMEDTLHLSHFQAGSFFTAMSIMGMMAAIIFGMLASRYGSRFLVGFAAIGGGVAMVFLGTSPTYIFALAMSAIVGFATMGCITPVMGLLSVWFASGHRGAVAGLAAAGGGMSFIVVGALVPWLTGRDGEEGWRQTWYVLGAILMVTGVLSLIFLRDRPAGGVGALRRAASWPLVAYRNPLVWLITFLAFCSGWCEGVYATFFGVYLEDEGVGGGMRGLLWIVLGLLGMAGGIFWGSISDRLGRGPGFLLSYIVVGIGCILFWIAPVMAGFIGSVVFFGISFRAAYTICAAAAGDYVPPQFAAAAFGLMGMGAGLGSATGPLLGGYIADVTGSVGWVFVVAAGAAAVAVFASAFLRRPPPLA